MSGGEKCGEIDLEYGVDDSRRQEDVASQFREWICSIDASAHGRVGVVAGGRPQFRRLVSLVHRIHDPSAKRDREWGNNSDVGEVNRSSACHALVDGIPGRSRNRAASGERIRRRPGLRGPANRPTCWRTPQSRSFKIAIAGTVRRSRRGAREGGSRCLAEKGKCPRWASRHGRCRGDGERLGKISARYGRCWGDRECLAKKSVRRGSGLSEGDRGGNWGFCWGRSLGRGLICRCAACEDRQNGD